MDEYYINSISSVRTRPKVRRHAHRPAGIYASIDLTLIASINRPAFALTADIIEKKSLIACI
jgi:hypothetical protein